MTPTERVVPKYYRARYRVYGHKGWQRFEERMLAFPEAAWSNVSQGERIEFEVVSIFPFSIFDEMPLLVTCNGEPAYRYDVQMGFRYEPLARTQWWADTLLREECLAFGYEVYELCKVPAEVKS